MLKEEKRKINKAICICLNPNCTEIILNWIIRKSPSIESKNIMAEYFKGRGYDYEIVREGKRWIFEAKRSQAFVSCSRTKANMVKKGLIEILDGIGPNAEGIRLTAKGKMKAKKNYSENY